MKSRYVPCVIFCATVLWVCSAFAQSWSPPSEPDVPPVISQTYRGDADGDRIDDELNAKSADAAQRRLLTVTKQEKRAAGAVVTEMAEVELIFNQQITQGQIDAFLLRGGQIEYMYKSVSYGWQGSIPVEFVETLPVVMGDTLVLVKGPKPLELDMDKATQTGRVRPVRTSGFAGNALGFDGDPSITIGIIDSGVDGSHPDLAGRMAYWKDFSDEREPNPVDYAGHGSHVAGIAVGTGQSSDSRPSQFLLRYTDIGDLEGLGTDSFRPSSVSLPISVYVEATSIWTGASMGRLALLRSPIGANQWHIQNEYSRSGESGLTLSFNLTPDASYVYALGLVNTGGAVEDYAISTSISGSHPGLAFNGFRGVAPGCRWAAARIERSDETIQETGGYCVDWWVSQAIDDFIENRRAHGIKVINISLGNPYTSCDTVIVSQLNTAIENGIVVALSAGNDGDNPSDPSIRDFKYAAKAITVGATNDENALTTYSSLGLAEPVDATEDHKPDLIAPGGSKYHTHIMSVDSGTSDGYGIADQQSDDYTNMSGTSMASPFVAGCAALVIDAMQQKGIVWNFFSDAHPLYVKMLLCATATETDSPREDGEFSDELTAQRAGPAKDFPSFPAGKDPYEGYGIINPDAAVEAVALSHSWGTTAQETFGANSEDRRAWARSVEMTAGVAYKIKLDNPSDGDFDLYLYSAEPSQTGAPVFLDTPSTNVGVHVDEIIEYIPPVDVSGIIVVKRISGYGRFELSSMASQTGRPGLDVLICGADGQAELDDIQEKLTGTGQFASVSTMNVNWQIPTLPELQTYDAVLVFRGSNYLSAGALGDVMADYVDTGGGVLGMVFEVANFSVSNAMQGRWASGYYDVIPSSGITAGPATLGTIYDSGHPIMRGVTRFDGGSAAGRPSAQDLMLGAVRIADWSDGSPLVATKMIGGARRVDLGFYPPSSDVMGSGWWDTSTDGALLMANALTWVAGEENEGTVQIFGHAYRAYQPNQVIDESDPGVIAGATITWWNAIDDSPGAVAAECRLPVGSVTSDSRGHYQFSVPYGWSGRVVGAKLGFGVGERDLTNVTSDQVLDMPLFHKPTLTLSGYVVEGNWWPAMSIPGATVKTMGTYAGMAETDSYGQYSIEVPYGHYGCVDVLKQGYYWFSDPSVGPMTSDTDFTFHLTKE